jgi:hypothetical protein
MVTVNGSSGLFCVPANPFERGKSFLERHLPCQCSQAFWFCNFNASGPINGVKFYKIKQYTVWHLKMWPLAVLTDDRITVDMYFNKKMFCRANTIVVLMRLPYLVLDIRTLNHCLVQQASWSRFFGNIHAASRN